MIEIIGVNQKHAWQKALENTLAYDFYHTLEHHQVSHDVQTETPKLIYFRRDDYLIVLPIILRNIPNEPLLRDVTSVYGYAGPLVSHLDMPDEVILDFKSSLIQWLSDNRVVTIFARLHPMYDYQEALLPDKSVYSLSETVSLDLKKSDEDTWSTYRSSLRYDIRKLRKEGFECSWLEDGEGLKQFIDIYEENMDRVNATPNYYFPMSYYEGLFHAKDFDCKIMAAKRDGRIAACSMFIHTKDGVQYHLSATTADYLKYSPVKLIIEEARMYYKNLGASWLHLGGGVGGKLDNLMNFKAAFSECRHQFKIWKYIVNESQYSQLNSKVLNTENQTSNFFPLYRIQ